MAQIKLPMTLEDIKKVLPHRYPFLLVDRMIEMDFENRKFSGYKNVTGNEEFFQGHFPGHPVMPGVLILEAMAQVGAVGLLSMPQNRGKIIYFMAIDEVKFRKPVTPGDRLMMTAEIVRLRSNAGISQTQAFVDEELVCEGMAKFSLVNREQGE